jgi:hypothetical protein
MLDSLQVKFAVVTNLVVKLFARYGIKVLMVDVKLYCRLRIRFCDMSEHESPKWIEDVNALGVAVRVTAMFDPSIYCSNAWIRASELCNQLASSDRFVMLGGMEKRQYTVDDAFSWCVVDELIIWAVPDANPLGVVVR